MSFKLAIIGAGSLVFARTLFTDIMSVPEFRDIEIAFTDINADNLEKVTYLCQRDLEANGIHTKIQSTLNRREAFKDARYIVNCVRVGCLEGFEKDVEIPLKYGGVPTIGLCHGEIHGEHQIAEALHIPHEELDFICAGINHQTWYISVKHHGVEMLDRIRDEFDKVEQFNRQEKVRIDILKRFGYYSTESNGHLSEYVAWYRKRPEEIERWIDTSDWIHGETGGYLRVTREERDWFETDYPKIAQEPPKKYDGSCRSKEHGSYILEALETGRRYRGHFNVMNEGCITNLPFECVVEVPCYVDGNGISVPKVGDLPLGCAAVCSQSIWVQKLSVEAAVHGDVQLLKQAAMMDPLTGAVCNPPEIWQMIDEMLIAEEEWLPQYTEAIAAAKENFAKGNLIPTKEDYRGAVRIRQKTVAEIEKEREKRVITAQ